MSKTDKTDPWEVRLKVDPSIRIEQHDHRDGICDIEEARTRFMFARYCGYHFIAKYYYTSGIYGRPKSEQAYRAEYNGKERTRVRMAMQSYRRLAPEDREDIDFQNFAHRHEALWDAF